MLIYMIPEKENNFTWKKKKKEAREREGGLRRTGLLSETRDPIIAAPSAARRSRGYGVRADVNTGTRKVEAMVKYGYLADIERTTMHPSFPTVTDYRAVLTSGCVHRRCGAWSGASSS